jgi:hypothetical protein
MSEVKRGRPLGPSSRDCAAKAAVGHSQVSVRAGLARGKAT